MTKFDQIAKAVKDNEGVLLIVTGPEKFDVHLLQRGTITEAQIERHLNVLYHEVMRQRHRGDCRLSDPVPDEIDLDALTLLDDEEDDGE